MDIVAWRVTRDVYTQPPYDPLDGSGAARAGGRWNSPGKPVVYLAWSVSLSVLETLVHAANLKSLTERLIASLTFHPDDVAEVPPITGRPPSEAESREFGDRWIRDRGKPVLRVPSVVIPSESNYVLNADHPEFARIRATASAWEPLPIDPRLLGAK